ncbi:MAG: tripartite tricarboxylate transporter TctB family protein [Lachnospiraceae bacterium]
MFRSNFWGSVHYLLVTGLFFWQTFYIQQSTSGTIGAITPRTVPRIILLFLAICAIVNLVHDIKSSTPYAPYIQVPFKYLVVALAFLFVALAVKKLGFVLCGIVFLFALFQVLDDRDLSKKSVFNNFILAVIFALVFCYGFRYGLNVRIPLYPR